jgi:hypothetical protein
MGETRFVIQEAMVEIKLRHTHCISQKGAIGEVSELAIHYKGIPRLDRPKAYRYIARAEKAIINHKIAIDIDKTGRHPTRGVLYIQSFDDIRRTIK